MTVLLYDHLYRENVGSLWYTTLNVVFGEASVRRLECADDILAETEGVFFLHGQGGDLAYAATWIATEGRYVVLVGSEAPPTYRPLPDAAESEGCRWGFCPWTAAEFQLQEIAGLRSFIATVTDNEAPDFKLFASETAVLNALAILAQGYLIVHAMEGAHSDLIPKRLHEAAKACAGVKTPTVKVQAHTFWEVFDGKNVEELVEAVTREWKGLGGGNGLDEDIGKLIRTIADKGAAAIAGKEAVAMVAGAYEAIEAKLGASRGK